MRTLSTCLAICMATALSSQSIHQEQLEYYNSLGKTWDQYEHEHTGTTLAPRSSFCTLDRVVYGWHPYWENGSEANYQWNLLSHLSYFSYEVDAATGNALTTHGFQTANAVTEALAQGVKVTLCVTLFSNHSTFFGSPTAQQTLIDNLITEVQNRGAHGVNIDFEGIPSSQSANFTAFMIDLCNQMHAAIPGSEVSTVLYAVDWSDVFDEPALDPYVDLFIIMGYAYYWSGSTTAGPTDPLYHFGSTYNYTLSRSVTYHLDEGVSRDKLILGLPYYGREYESTSNALGAAVFSPPNSNVLFYKEVRDNVSGDFSPANYGFDTESYSNYWIYPDGGNYQHAFCNSAAALGYRMDLIDQTGIGGMGIWALGYDDGYSDYWDEIESHFTDCAVEQCMDTIYDLGGPNKNYYDDEYFVQTISHSAAATVTLDFLNFSVEVGWDTLFIYDGPTTASPLIGNYTGTTSPGTITSTGNAITLEWRSDGATVGEGWEAIYNCQLLGTEENTINNVRFYPNPAQDVVTVELSAPCSGRIVDAMGRTVMELDLSEGRNSVDISDLANGSYFLRLSINALESGYQLIKF